MIKYNTVHIPVFRSILLFFAVLFVLHSKAQVVMNLQLPPMGVTIKPQLWNLSIVNTTNQDIQGQVQVLLTNIGNNQKVLSGTTRLLMFPRGLKQITINEVAPVSYSVFSSASGVNNSPDGFLPIGVYDVCYTLLQQKNDYTERIAEVCQTITIEPLSPPQLAYPGNTEEITNSRPVFTWLPPAPINTFSFLSYDYTLVEVQKTQSPSDAIQQNIPVATTHSINNNSFPYPASKSALDTGKLYAWQIKAKNAGNSIANSDIWTFRVKHEKPDPSIPALNYYLKCSKDAGGAAGICKGTLFYEFNNENNDPAVQIKLFDITGSGKHHIDLDSSIVTMRPGQNLKKLDFDKPHQLTDKHTYLLELTNARLEHWFLRFQYQKP